MSYSPTYPEKFRRDIAPFYNYQLLLYVSQVELVLSWWRLLFSVDQMSSALPVTSPPMSAAGATSTVGVAEPRSKDTAATTHDANEGDQQATPAVNQMLRCADCEYETASRAQFKMHSMTHRPRKWRCIHCGLNFALLYVTHFCCYVQ